MENCHMYIVRSVSRSLEVWGRRPEKVFAPRPLKTRKCGETPPLKNCGHVKRI